MIVQEGKYFLYRHIREDKNEPFYIGIGTKVVGYGIQGAYQRSISKTDRNQIWSAIVKKTSYRVEILLESNDLEFIKQKEIEFISLYGRIVNRNGPLSNITDGGDGGGATTKKQEEVIERFKTLHNNKYDYSKFKYEHSRIKSTIICPKHGEYQQNAETHLKGSGCPKCGNESRTRRDSKIKNAAAKFPDRIKELYGDRFDCSLAEYKGQKVKVELICNEHGSFWQYPSDLMQGHHCQKCGKESIRKSKFKPVDITYKGVRYKFNSMNECLSTLKISDPTARKYIN